MDLGKVVGMARQNTRYGGDDDGLLEDEAKPETIFRFVHPGEYVCAGALAADITVGARRTEDMELIVLQETWVLELQPPGVREVLLERVGDKATIVRSETLAKVDLLVGLEQGFVRDAASRLIEEEYSFGDAVVVNGTQPKGLYILVDGAAQILGLNGTRLSLLRPGASFGALALREPAPVAELRVVVTSAKALFFVLPRKLAQQVIDDEKVRVRFQTIQDILYPTDEVLKGLEEDVLAWRRYIKKSVEPHVVEP